MSETFNEQISEFVDDEMSSEECEFFVRRLQNDAPARGRYLRYQLIGAAMRREYPVAAVPPRRPARAFNGRRVVAVAGIAAGVALAAVLVFRFTGGGLPEGGGELARPAGNDDTVQFAADGVESPNASAPATSPASHRPALASTRLTGIQYLMHHTGYTAGLSRTTMYLSFLAAADNPTVADAAVTGRAAAVAGPAAADAAEAGSR